MNALRRPLPLLGPLLALWLLAFQWLAVVHSTRHEIVSQGTEPTCEICLIAHGYGAAPSNVALPSMPVPQTVYAVVHPEFTLPALRALRPQTRGPPSFLA